MSAPTGKLPVLEKVGYSVGDAAANFVYQTMLLFQLNFYTDTVGIAAAVAGSLLLVGRLWDALFDPIMGVISDSTKTRWGRFRPWVLWSAVPWGVAMVLAFSTPAYATTGKVIYACLTNVLLMTLYSVNNTPYSAMTGVMTPDVNERTSLSSYRFVAAMIAQLVVGGFTLPLVAKFGQGNNAKGWQMTMALWAVVCVALFIITFLSTRERVQPDPKQTAIGAQDFVHLIRNGPWIVMFIATLLHLIGVAMRGGTVLYYFEYYVSRERLWSLLQSLGLTHGDGHGMWHGLLNAFGLMVNAERTNVASVGYSLFIMFSQFVTILGVMCATLLSIRFGKKAVVLVGFLLTTVFTAAFILLPPDAIAATFALELLRALAYAPTIPLIWAMFADVTDYAEWKTGRRTTGLIFATVMFALKAGLSFGVAIGGWLLAAYAYEANVAQTAQALMGIRLTVSVYPALFYFLVALCLCFYGIGKDLNIHIQDELAERRRLFQV